MEISNKGEKQFANFLVQQGKRFIPHPSIKLDNIRIIPDFFCPDNQTYYEVIGTRQAYHIRKNKIQQAIRLGLNIKIVSPDGSPYPWPSRRGKGINRINSVGEIIGLEPKSKIGKKIKSIGITSPQQLAKITGKTYDMALKVWNGKTNLSINMAKKIKSSTGASLDFLLN